MMYELNMHLNLENSNVVHFVKTCPVKLYMYLQARVFNCTCASLVCEKVVGPKPDHPNSCYGHDLSFHV